MEKARNFNDGLLAKAAIVGMGVLGAATSQLELGTVFPDSVSAEKDHPAKTAQASYTPTRPCESVDSLSPDPQWHAQYNFKTPNGKARINSVRPGGLTRFVARIAGGNVEAFNLYALTGPGGASSNDIEVPKRGSHPAWTPTGGRPHWAIKELCHWKDKRNISFLVKIDSQAKSGSKTCLDTNTLTSTADKKSVPGDLTPHCIKVK